MNKTTHKTITGIISITQKGVGYVPCADTNEDIEIEPGATDTAFNGDEVEVLLLPKMRSMRRQKGKVIKVTKRAREQFVGTIEKENGNYFLAPDNKRIHLDITITNTDKATLDTKALVRVTNWKDGFPYGEIIKTIGKAGLHETEMQAIILEKGFEADFPTEVTQEAQKIAKSEYITQADIDKRVDFRKTTTFTIDPADAKDFDDAISVKNIRDNTYEIGIHIADVTHYVRPNTKLDKEARNRATSIYLVDRTIPMLPEELSNDICSLKPDVDRLAFSAIFTIDLDGKVTDRRFTKTIIHSDKRFTYQDAQDILDNGSGEFHDELVVMTTIAQALKKERIKNGGLEFETDEVKFELAEDGTPIKAHIKERLEVMKTIEDLMLLANKEVAEFVDRKSDNDSKQDLTFIYRIHDIPDNERIEELAIFAQALGYDLEHDDGKVTSKNMAKLLKSVKGTPEESVITTATLRSMAKAIYTHKNIGHFSLGFKHYTHFTSPIRRYPDMMVHRILASCLGAEKISKEELAIYRATALSASRREVEAVRAERDSVKYKQTEYMQKRIGQKFDATVTGVTKWGMFVAEDETKAEGLIRAADIPGDYYDIDEKHYTLVGKRTGKKYRIGDKIKVTLISADLKTKQIDWKIAV